jgi:hydrogenase expression/formation protein HypE
MGKFTFEELQEILHCVTTNQNVVIPPQPGFDAGVHILDPDTYLVIATDPCIGVPRSWFGWLMIHYSASDVALFGAKPQFCTINLLGPIGTEKTRFIEIMEQACQACVALGITIITGHTGTYNGISEIVATCTVYGTVPTNQLITPGGAQPEDNILLTKPIGLETLINYTFAHQDKASQLFGAEQVSRTLQQIPLQSCVEDALLLAANGVSAMHDATEGGLIAALHEMADASHLGFSVEVAKLPFTPETQQLSQHFRLSQVQKLSMSSTGTLLAAIAPQQTAKAIHVLKNAGLQPQVVGQFKEDTDTRVLLTEKQETPFPRQSNDPYTVLFHS